MAVLTTRIWRSLGKSVVTPSLVVAGAGRLVDFMKQVFGALLNDRFADGQDVSWNGQDVSWIWNVDYEFLAKRVSACWAGGDRCEDIALRLKYAGWPAPSATAREPGTFLDALLATTSPGEDVFLIPTYTAMLDLRAELAHRGATSQFWKR